MKHILFILISIAFLQAPTSICSGNSPKTYICEPTANNKKDFAKTPEERTEEAFYSFIINDVIGSKATSKTGNKYYYTGFSDANDAFDKMLNLILPTTPRIIFNRTKVYKTDLITVTWKENTKTKTDVKDGFAQIEVVFKNRDKAKYTVVFCKK